MSKDTQRRPAARDFTDAGLDRRFSKGEVPDADVPDGAYDNYVAAGLIEPAPDAEPKGKGKSDA